MTLSAYLASRGIRPTDLARELDVATSMITRFLRGERGLSLEVAVKIEKHTAGEVTCSDLAPAYVQTSSGVVAA